MKFFWCKVKNNVAHVSISDENEILRRSLNKSNLKDILQILQLISANLHKLQKMKFNFTPETKRYGSEKRCFNANPLF
jgi:hypothetical protein